MSDRRPLLILPEPEKIDMRKKAKEQLRPMLTCLFVGGGADGEMLEVPDTDEWCMRKGNRYTRQLVQWGTKYYAVMISDDFRYEDLMQRLLCGYKTETVRSRSERVEIRAPGRKFDFTV